MQRLHLDDMVGHVLEKEDWDVVNLPAIATEPEVWRYDTLFGPTVYVRQPGDLLHAARESLKELDAQRRTMGEYVFSAQYQQAPVPLGGGMVKLEWFTHYTPAQLPEHFEMVVQSWDTANKESELSDYSVCTTWGIKRKQYFLLDVFRRRLEYPAIKRKVIDHALRWEANRVLIEDKASGTQLIQELKQTYSRMTGVKSEGDKVMRMLAQTPEIEAGNVLLPMEAAWLSEYLIELTSFPKAKYDDQVDSTAQALKWMTDAMRVPNITQFYQQEWERENGRPWEDQ